MRNLGYSSPMLLTIEEDPADPGLFVDNHNLRNREAVKLIGIYGGVSSRVREIQEVSLLR